MMLPASSGATPWSAGADVLGAGLSRRAIVEATGSRRSSTEHRATPGDLEPEPGWAMGNAGIVREPLRHARTHTGREPGYFVPWPDQPVVGSAAAGR